MALSYLLAEIMLAKRKTAKEVAESNCTHQMECNIGNQNHD